MEKRNILFFGGIGIALSLSILFLSIPCLASELYGMAARRAAEEMQSEIQAWIASYPQPRWPVEVAVWPVANDRKDALRTRFTEQMTQSGVFKVLPCVNSPEMDAYRDYIAAQAEKKTSHLIDPDSKILPEQARQARYMIDPRIESYREQSHRAEMVFAATLLDFKGEPGKKGISYIVRTAEVSVTDLDAKSWIWRSAAVLFSMFCGWQYLRFFNRTSPHYWSTWIVVGSIPLGIFWWLIGRFL